MVQLIRKLSSHLIVPMGWTILIIILLCLPGSYIPGSGIHIPHLDKLVHLALFSGFVCLWGGYFYNRTGEKLNYLKVFLISCISMALGVVLEYIQAHFIPRRSFDEGDIVANIVGSLLGVILIFLFFAKKNQDQSSS